MKTLKKITLEVLYRLWVIFITIPVVMLIQAIAVAINGRQGLTYVNDIIQQAERKRQNNG